MTTCPTTDTIQVLPELEAAALNKLPQQTPGPEVAQLALCTFSLSLSLMPCRKPSPQARLYREV